MQKILKIGITGSIICLLTYMLVIGYQPEVILNDVGIIVSEATAGMGILWIIKGGI